MDALVQMNRHDLNLLAIKEGRVIYLAAADQAIDAGAPAEVVLGYRLQAALGAASQTRYVEIWQGCQVGVGEFGDIVVRFWRGKTRKSSRLEWAYSNSTRQWNVWEFNQVGGFKMLSMNPPIQDLMEACECACGFRLEKSK